MLQLATDLSLFHKPSHDLGVVSLRFEQDFDGDVAAEVDIAALEDRPHAAAGDLALKLVPAPAFLGRRQHHRRAGFDKRLLIVNQLVQVDMGRRAGAEIPG